MAMAFRGVAPQPTKEDLMRLAALRAGALPPRDADGAPPVDVLPNGPALMRAPQGIFSSPGMDNSTLAAKNVLDTTMAQNAADPSSQPVQPTSFSPPGSSFSGGGYGATSPMAGRNRPGMAFRGPSNGSTALTPTDPASAPTGIAGLDSAAPLDLSPTARIADPTKGGVNDAIHPKFFEYGGVGRKIAGVLADGLTDWAAMGGSPTAMQRIQQNGLNQNAARTFATWQQQAEVRRQQELEDRAYEDNKPRFFSGGQDQVEYDPATGTANKIYDAPRPEQEYASQFGQPGTPGFQKALQDYVLRQWGSTAVEAKSGLDDERFQHRADLKGVPTYANLHPHAPAARAPRPLTTNNVVGAVLHKGAAGQPLNPQEQQIFSSYVNGRRGGRGAAAGAGGAGAGGVTEGTIITNPQTKARMIRKGGQWVAL
jgi:hypothetical protein